MKLSAVRKVLETIVFLALGSFGTIDPKLSHGTSSKFADVRTHLRKVSKITLSSIRDSQNWSLFSYSLLAILSPIDYNKEKLYGDSYDNQIPKDFYYIEKPD